MNIHEQLNRTALSAGIDVIGIDTAAKICAVIYEYDDERFTHSPKLRADLQYIQERYGVQGASKPSGWFAKFFSHYVHELEAEYEKAGKREYPKWAKSLFRDRYNIVI